MLAEQTAGRLSLSTMAAPLACLESTCGWLHIYDNSALQIIVDSMLKVSSATPLLQEDVFEGYPAAQWAAHAKRKSSVASSVTRLNGQLKAKLASLSNQDVVYNADPWVGTSPPPKIHTPSFDAWSGWGRRLCDCSPGTCSDNEETNVQQTDDVMAAGDESRTAHAVSDAHADANAQFNAVPVSNHADAQDEGALLLHLATSLSGHAPKRAETDAHPNDDIAKDNLAPTEIHADSAPQLLADIPSKSWERPRLFKLWNKIKDEAAADRIGDWLKDRFFHKTGTRIKNMDRAVAALSNTELNAVLKYCSSLDPTVLEIPVYKVVSPVEPSACTLDAQEPPRLLIDKEPKTTENTHGCKIAGITKRGMAQSRRR